MPYLPAARFEGSFWRIDLKLLHIRLSIAMSFVFKQDFIVSWAEIQLPQQSHLDIGFIYFKSKEYN